jgi:hypothetical protein
LRDAALILGEKLTAPLSGQPFHRTALLVLHSTPLDVMWTVFDRHMRGLDLSGSRPPPIRCKP